MCNENAKDNNPLNLECASFPDENVRKLRRLGEGYTWTCSKCFDQYVVVNGKGSLWFWKKVECKLERDLKAL